MARPMNRPPSKKKTLGSANGARMERVLSRPLPGGMTCKAAHRTTASKPVAASGIGSVTHQIRVSNKMPASRCASGRSVPGSVRNSQPRRTSGPRTKPIRSGANQRCQKLEITTVVDMSVFSWLAATRSLQSGARRGFRCLHAPLRRLRVAAACSFEARLTIAAHSGSSAVPVRDYRRKQCGCGAASGCS